MLSPPPNSAYADAQAIAATQALIQNTAVGVKEFFARQLASQRSVAHFGQVVCGALFTWSVAGLDTIDGQTGGKGD